MEDGGAGQKLQESGAPAVRLPELRIADGLDQASVYLDTCSLVTLVCWDWYPGIMRFAKDAGVTCCVTPRVLNEYGDLWPSDLGRMLTGAGCKPNMDVAAQMRDVPELSLAQRALLIDLVNELSSRLDFSCRGAEAGEIETIAYGLALADFVLCDDLKGISAIRSVLHANAQDFDDMLPDRAPLRRRWAAGKASIIGSAGEPVALAAALGFLDMTLLKNCREAHEQAGEGMRKVIKSWIDLRSQPLKQRKRIRKLASFWKARFVEE